MIFDISALLDCPFREWKGQRCVLRAGQGFVPL